ncbi:MAG TPA: hypothetical protein VLK79_01790 [Gaiellales bacterium]|nr:hypothetical protein [Gaiellales bacterium]
MGKGYAEGPAAEEAEAARERGDHLVRPDATVTRRVVLGSTPDNPTQHLIGYADEVDPDALFASGKAWGIKVVNAVE